MHDEFEITVHPQQNLEDNLAERDETGDAEEGFAIYSPSGFAIYSPSGFAIYSPSGFAIYSPSGFAIY